ncbi:MAG TPA: flagellar biosynthesis protein FlhB [Clostridiaceae bacterium]|nr:flagellar biosynthesis protein FlhB [Clostridiaceae bacterium]
MTANKVNTDCILKINLQLFADENKTEKATPKKRQEARKKGHVFQSREITSAILLLVVFTALRIFGGSMYNELKVFTETTLTGYQRDNLLFTIDGFTKLFNSITMTVIKMSAPLFLVALVASLAACYAQVGFIFTPSTLVFKLSRISPINGLKRIFSFRSLTELLKAIIKITVVFYLGYTFLKGEAPNILNLMDMDIISIASYICNAAISLALRICIVLVLFGLLDYGYQWWQYEKELRMTKQEIKEEYKQTEGNPEIKSRIKQKQRQLSMRRMMHDVPRADVVITNPTHYAVALKYDPGISDAPVVLAKGQDYIALRIKDIAKENGVEIVENKPLARTLYETVDVGESIPPELYQAVAEVLAFIYSLRNNVPWKGGSSIR